MEAIDYEGLARAHMAEQVRKTGVTQSALSAYWDRIVDPNDFARTFELFRETAVPLIQAGRIGSESLADAYYHGLLDLEGLPRTSIPPHENISAGAVRSSLSGAVKADYTAWRLARGDDPDALMRAAKTAMLGSAKRQVLNASRERLIERRKTDPNIRGWARVSDGAPCAFCAMLVSRGPVYSEHSVRFQAHDRCGCSVRLVTYRDDSGGWAEDAKRYRDMWERFGGGAEGLPGFREALAEVRLKQSLDLAA